MTDGQSSNRRGASGDWLGRVVDGRYRVERVLGAGGMGTVFLARDERMSRLVVVKVPHARLLDDEGFRARFGKEIRALTSLSHTHVVKVLDAGEAVGRAGETPTPFAVLEYLEGGSLKDRLESRGVQTPTDVLAWLPDIAKALDFIHAQGVVHRDVKPGNILFDRAGNAILADFGIAKALSTADTGLTRTGFTPGSPPYMGPEVGLGATLGPSYDQYALGVLVYEALSGALPHEGTSGEVLIAKKAYVEPIDLERKAPKVADGVRAAVMQALSCAPTARFASCRAFAQALSSGASSPGASATKSAKRAKPADVTIGVETEEGAPPKGAATRVPPPPERPSVRAVTRPAVPPAPPPPPPRPPAPPPPPPPIRKQTAVASGGPVVGPELFSSPSPARPAGAKAPPKKPGSRVGAFLGLLAIVGGIVWLRNLDPPDPRRNLGRFGSSRVFTQEMASLLGEWTLDVGATQDRGGVAPLVHAPVDGPGNDVGARGKALLDDVLRFSAKLELLGDGTYRSSLADDNGDVVKTTEGTWTRAQDRVTMVATRVDGREPTGSSATPAVLLVEGSHLVTVPTSPDDVPRVFSRTLPGPIPLGIIPSEKDVATEAEHKR